MKIIKITLSYFKKHSFILIGLIFVIISTVALSIVTPQVLKIIIDEVLPSSTSLLFTYALFYTSLLILAALINCLKEVLLVMVSQGIGKDLRIKMLEKVDRLTFTIFKELDTGSLEAYFSNDVDEINTLITSGVLSIAIDLFKIIGILISIFIFSLYLGLITLAVLPFIFLFTLFVKKRMFQAQKKNRILEASVNNHILESIDAIETIKSYRIYDEENQKYDKVLKEHYNTNQTANFYDAFFSPMMNIIKFSVIVLILILTGYNQQLFGLTIGMVVSTIDLITNLFSPIEALGMEIQTIQKSISAFKRINEFFHFEEDEDKKKYDDFFSTSLTLCFDDVTFSYDGVTNVLEHFNLKLENKNRLVLKGESGAGKSTIFRLAYGLIKPTQGRVTINGLDTYYLPNDLKRQLFAIVYQDYFFSNGTIKEELTLKNPSFTDEEIYECLKRVGLDRIKDITLPFSLHDYSTGELSLFNIARAILLHSKILFLDEMNAKVDGITAKEIMNTINTVAKDKMVLSITHYGELIEDSTILQLQK